MPVLENCLPVRLGVIQGSALRMEPMCKIFSGELLEYMFSSLQLAPQEL